MTYGKVTFALIRLRDANTGQCIVVKDPGPTFYRPTEKQQAGVQAKTNQRKETSYARYDADRTSAQVIW